MKTLQRAGLWALIVAISAIGINRIESFLDGKDQIISILLTIGCVFVVYTTFEILFPRKN
jgi:hypothetical protein